MDSLPSYISLHLSPPGGTSVCVAGTWLRLDVPLTNWPIRLRRQWGRRVQFLFSKTRTGNGEPFKHGNRVDTGEKIVMCSSVGCCCIKREAQTNEDCNKFVFGICAEATLQANSGAPLRLDTIGTLTGVTKQRVDQIFHRSQQRLVAAILKDPLLLAFCREYGLGASEES